MSRGDDEAGSAPNDAQESVDDVYWVGPALPTALGDLAALPIPGTDLIFASVRVFCASADFDRS